ncbi:hypothetical protein ACFY7C_36595 [Streptomyces sp. NPDC012769]|uniref:hypothetical protein n=1 Tax=Streptomyces sp. NPDC012769 TaxID=3364848 RepID=UPI00369ACEC1
MSNDVAYPVFRTPDPALALCTARRLMEFGRCEHSEVSAYAELSSVAEVRRMAKAEAGFHGESKHAEVTLLFNTHTRELDEPTDDHSVLVHVRSAVFDGRQGNEPYAHWLAAQVGLTVIGPAQRC